MTVDITKTPLEAAGEKPAFFDDPAVDRVLAIAMAVAEEVAVTGERLDTLEQVLEACERYSGYVEKSGDAALLPRRHRLGAGAQ